MQNGTAHKREVMLFPESHFVSQTSKLGKQYTSASIYRSVKQIFNAEANLKWNWFLMSVLGKLRSYFLALCRPPKALSQAREGPT